MKKQISALLAALLLAATLAACGDKTPTVTTASAETSDPASTGEETLGVPETADYGGEAFNILSAGNVAYADFTADENASTPLDSAQYRRKALVEQNYKVKIGETVEKA